MPNITNDGVGSYLTTSRRSYIAAATFNSHFFAYTVTHDNGVATGSLSSVPGANSGNCPAGRILRETGRKIFPSVNPGVSVFMVSVYDDQTLLNGFIDPNSPVFAVFSTDKSNFLPNSTDPVGGLPDAGAPVITNGVVRASNIYVSSIMQAADVIVTGDVTCNTLHYSTLYGAVYLGTTLGAIGTNKYTTITIDGNEYKIALYT